MVNEAEKWKLYKYLDPFESDYLGIVYIYIKNNLIWIYSWIYTTIVYTVYSFYGNQLVFMKYCIYFQFQKKKKRI